MSAHDIAIDPTEFRKVLGRVQALNVQREGDPLLYLRGSYGGFAAKS